MDKLLLVLPANTYRARRFLEAAHRLGIQVAIATDSEMGAADPSGMVFDRLDFCDPGQAADELAALARSYGIDRAMALDEGGVEIAALTNARISGSGVGLEGVLATRDKAALRKTLTAAGIPQPKYTHTSQGSALDTTQLAFPLVAKPSKGSGSIGVSLARNPSELKRSAEIAISAGEKMGFASSGVVVEEYVDGDEYAVEALIVRGELRILAIFEKPDPLPGPYFAETIYVTPPRTDEATKDKIRQSVLAVVRALSLPDGPVHAEVRINPDGVCVPIDVAARSIGGHCSDALSFAFSATLEDLILANATGRELASTARENQASGVFMIPVATEGILTTVNGVEEASKVRFVQGVEISLPVGERVHPLPFDNRYMGFIFAKAPGPTAVVSALNTARNLLRFEIDTRSTPDA